MTTTASIAPGLATGTWSIDASHSSVAFVARHLMVSKVRGSFGEFSGSIVIGEDLASSRVDAIVQVASISTGDASRDEHLKSSDFFALDAHPTWSFQSTSIERAGSDFKLHGDLTIKGVSKPVTFDLEFEGVATDPWGNTKAAFSAETEVNRKDFGLEWNVALETGGVLVGEKVRIQLDIQAVRNADEPAA